MTDNDLQFGSFDRDQSLWSHLNCEPSFYLVPWPCTTTMRSLQSGSAECRRPSSLPLARPSSPPLVRLSSLPLSLLLHHWWPMIFHRTSWRRICKFRRSSCLLSWSIAIRDTDPCWWLSLKWSYFWSAERNFSQSALQHQVDLWYHAAKCSLCRSSE